MYIIGVDEVGRGPLAGPVTVCVVACEEKIYTKLKRDKRLPPVGKDSKKLSAEAREKYAKILKNTGIRYEVVHISNKVIDSRGISFAIRKAMTDGLKRLRVNPVRGREGPQRASTSNGINPKNCDVRLDGSLKAPLEFVKQRTIIKGDEKERVIAWASILAKVSRDDLMRKLAKKYPNYGLEIHKGYGTLKHRQAIKKHGLSDIHRKTFCRSIDRFI